MKTRIRNLTKRTILLIMLDLNSAATASGRGARDLIREIESGVIHSSETPNGHLLICARSLQLPETKQEGTQS